MGNTSDRAFNSDSLLALSIHSRTSNESLEEKVASLFEQFSQPLYRYLLLLTWNPQDSEELVQDVFLQLHRQLLEQKPIDNMRAWIFRVAHNLAIDRGRTARDADSLSEAETNRRAEGQLSRTVPNPEMIVLQRERELALAQAVRALPALQRHVLLLRREGFRYREIASILDIGETTVIDNITRAIDRLHRELHVHAK